MRLALSIPALIGAAALIHAQTQSERTRASSTEVGTAIWRGMPVHYVIKDGLPVFEGDIILDNADFDPEAPGAPPRHLKDPRNSGRIATLSSQTLSHQILAPQTLGVIYPSYLWPQIGGVYRIPYIVTSGSANLNSAISQYNATFAGLIQWVPHSAEADYVNFFLNPADQSGAGESNVGRVGGEETVNCAINCAVSVIVHEMGHATGLWHEQSRPDRNTYVTLNGTHIQAQTLFTDDAVVADNAYIYGPYNYSSVMQYGAFSNSADGSQTIQSIPAGMSLGNQTYYSSADIDTIRRLYSATPTSVTVDTNPTGLQAIVDGATVTTPQVYTNWALNSTHTLAIPDGILNSGLQSLGSFDYQFGRWNDNGAAGHTIAISPGSGLPGYPATAPAQTVYTANFIQWSPFSPGSADPSGAGTIGTTPSPTTFTGVGQFFMDDQFVAITANANSGYNFAEWTGTIRCDVGCVLSTRGNPLTLPYNVTSMLAPFFTTSQVTTFTSNPSGQQIQIDSQTYTTPITFSPDPSLNGNTWASGTSHTVAVLSPQNPWSPNTSYVWNNWSDGKAQSHSISVPSGDSTLTANFNIQVGVVLGANSSCAGSAAANPPGPSNTGTSVTFTAAPASGFVFTQWEGALSGSTNPLAAPVNHEEYVQADFNTLSAPLAITSISPTNVNAGAAAFTLTVNGTGFTNPSGGAGTYAFVYYNSAYTYRPATYISSTELQIPLQAADVAASGAIQILLQNRNTAGDCSVSASTPLTISPPPAPSLRISSNHTGNFTQGQTGAAYMLTVTNVSGAAPTNATVTVTDTLPAGLTATAIIGTNWNCTLGTLTCTRSDVLSANANYPAITVTATVTAAADESVNNVANVTGGGSAAAGGSDATLIFSLCDLKQTGTVAVSDVQLIINEALGVSPVTYDLSGTGVANVVDVQIEINAALGLGCAAK